MTFPPTRPSSDRGPGFRVCQPGNWATLLETHGNLLIIGPPSATDAFLLAAGSLLRPPVRSVVCDAGLSIGSAAGTLILRNVDTLTGEHQRALLRWLDAESNRQTQIISLTTAPLYPLVQAGTFRDELYYRLNVIHLQIASD